LEFNMSSRRKSAAETIPGSRHAVKPSPRKATCHLEFLQKLESFRHLSAGWDSYEAEPPNETAIDWAGRTLDILCQMGFAADRIAPSVEGGVAISWRRGRKNANIECFNTGEFLAATSDGTGNPHVRELSGEDLAQEMEAIRAYIER
jgi:hypothetical protein